MRSKTSCAVCALMIGAATLPASAQTVEGQATSTSEKVASTSDIIVTGSRIARRDFTSTSPITTIGKEFISKSDSPTLESSLNQLPQIAASASSSTNTQARGGQASINLRGLGQQRTLVLLDGRRIQPSSPDGAVDLNIIPAALVGSVEVITGGASAIYGSDAVTGVVNLKLRRNLDGLEASAKFGISDMGDAATRDFNIIGGTKFAEGRGSIIASINYSQRDDAPFTNRPHLRGQVLAPAIPNTLVNVAASNLPSQAAVNTIFSRYGAGPGAVSRTTQLSFNLDGTLFSPIGVVNYRGSRELPYRIFNNSLNYALSETYTAQTPLERVSAFGHAEFELADSLSIFAEGLYTNYSVTTGGAYANAGSTSGRSLSVPVTNPFIPTDLRTYLGSRPNPNAPFTVSRFTVEAGQRQERNEYDVYQFTGGVNGKLASDSISWSLVGSYGKTIQATTYRGYPSAAAIQTLLSAPDGGRSICEGGYNLFGPQPVSASCSDYISRVARNRTKLTQMTVEGNLFGDLFDLPAGKLKFAAGASYRKNTYAFAADPLISSGELANFLPVFGSSGNTKAVEGYVELLIPVLRDVTLIKEFNLAPSYRYSDYNTVGGISTYKIDADWLVIEGMRLRGGYSRAIRAPSAGELFAATNLGQSPIGSPGLIGLGDPCDIRGAYRAAGSATSAQVRGLCLAQGVPANLIDSFTNTNPRIPFQGGGNTGLASEKADTYSVGVVLNPKFASPWLSRVNLSVDYYNIAITQAIGQITNNVALSQCFDPVGNPNFSNNNYYCGLLTRDLNNGQISLIGNPLLNLASYSSSGIDTQIDWRVNFDDIGLGGNGSFALNSIVSYLGSFRIQNLTGAPKLEYAGTIGNQQIDLFATAHPKWKATTSGTLTFGDMSASIRWRFLDKMENAANVGTGGTARGVKAVSYFDLDVGTKVADRIELRAGAVNFLDKKPPILFENPTGVLMTEPYTYDLIGRRFYVSVNTKF
ncbi:TonB-dependent receptor [Sphingobium sp. SCG-1]|uniref:TonB-dependent receptor domain-containing protein n=1 Tax=Sphingobium sp. SCG-1 TaxID=2072936 RepID=UPI000CD6AA8D|nr:TonB-dependent receptor [Sphingobium sp. SCG-1]AUW57015.1 TonB-dependent receptor [Sphingobium sp. SCG-1]